MWNRYNDAQCTGEAGVQCLVSVSSADADAQLPGHHTPGPCATLTHVPEVPKFQRGFRTIIRENVTWFWHPQTPYTKVEFVLLVPLSAVVRWCRTGDRVPTCRGQHQPTLALASTVSSNVWHNTDIDTNREEFTYIYNNYQGDPFECVHHIQKWFSSYIL